MINFLQNRKKWKNTKRKKIIKIQWNFEDLSEFNYPAEEYKF